MYSYLGKYFLGTINSKAGIKSDAGRVVQKAADGVSLGKGTVTIKARRAALRVITIEENLGKGIPQKDANSLVSESISLTVGKNHRAENVVLPEIGINSRKE